MKDILTHITTWVSLEDRKWKKPITKKPKCCMIALRGGTLEEAPRASSQRQKAEWGLPGAGGVGSRELASEGCRVSVLQDEEVWGWRVVMVAQQCACTSCH